MLVFCWRTGTGTPPTETQTCQDVLKLLEIRNELFFFRFVLRKHVKNTRLSGFDVVEMHNRLTWKVRIWGSCVFGNCGFRYFANGWFWKSCFWETRDIGICLRCGTIGRSGNRKPLIVKAREIVISRVGHLGILKSTLENANFPQFLKPKCPPKQALQHPNIFKS